MNRRARGIVFVWRLLMQARKARLAAESRLRAASRCLYCTGRGRPTRAHGDCSLCSPDYCGHCEGTGQADIGLPPWLVEALDGVAAQMRELERHLERGLLRLARQHPQWPAIRSVIGRWPGVGEGLAAALLGIVGDLRQFPAPRSLHRYMGMGVGPDGRALRRRRGVVAPWRGEGRAWCHLVMDQWLHWGRRPPGWDELLAYETAKGEKRAKVRTARKMVQRLLTELWAAANADAQEVV